MWTFRFAEDLTAVDQPVLSERKSETHAKISLHTKKREMTAVLESMVKPNWLPAICQDDGWNVIWRLPLATPALIKFVSGSTTDSGMIQTAAFVKKRRL
jgi:hypothetical protein